MAHHLAEKLAAEKAARGFSKKALSEECTDLILKLWAHRHSMPDGVRPFGSFEALFQVLQGLRNDIPRNSLLRSEPPRAKTSKEVEMLLSAAERIDGAASLLIRYMLAQAVDKIPVSDKRWTKLRAAVAPSSWDMRIVLKFAAEADTLVDEKQKLEKAAVEEVLGMVKSLEAFIGISEALRQYLKLRISSCKTAA